MNFLFICIAVMGAYWGLYWLITTEIKDSNYEILDKLKWVERQNNLLREEINELRLQLDNVWVSTQVIKDYTRPEDKEE